jgi:hypothetical protein
MLQLYVWIYELRIISGSAGEYYSSCTRVLLNLAYTANMCIIWPLILVRLAYSTIEVIIDHRQ